MSDNEIKMKLLDTAIAMEDETRLWWKAHYAMRFGDLDVAIATLKNIELSYGLNTAYIEILSELIRRKEQE